LNTKANNDCQSKSLWVLGLGNILLKDDGIGVRVVEQLQDQDLPENVEIVDGGTASLDILLPADGIEKLIVIDAMRAGREPGSIYKAGFKGTERKKLQDHFELDNKISLHQVGLLDALTLAEKTNCLPKEIVIFGVEPEDISCGMELTEALKGRLLEIVNKVLEEIRNDIHTR